MRSMPVFRESGDTMYYVKPIYYDTLDPYKEVEHNGIQYSNCRAFDKICRYQNLRQVVHNPADVDDRYISFETTNPAYSNATFRYYDVAPNEENRLDLIADKFYGSAQYAWIIAYFNGISDGFSVRAGQRIKIMKNIMDLFNNGEMLAPIPAMMLNLGTE